MRAVAWTLLAGSMIFLAWSILASPGCDRAEPQGEPDWDEIERHLPRSISLPTRLDQRPYLKWPNKKRDGPTVRDQLMRLGVRIKGGSLCSRSGKQIVFRFHDSQRAVRFDKKLRDEFAS